MDQRLALNGNGETFGADMALLTLEKYRWGHGYHFDKAGIKTAMTLFQDILGGELAAGIFADHGAP